MAESWRCLGVVKCVDLREETWVAICSLGCRLIGKSKEKSAGQYVLATHFVECHMDVVAPYLREGPLDLSECRWVNYGSPFDYDFEIRDQPDKPIDSEQSTFDDWAHAVDQLIADVRGHTHG